MKIILDFIPPTINKYIGRTNIWEYQKDKKIICEKVKKQSLGIHPKIDKCKMKITYYFKDKRRRDPSNYEKMLLDALVSADIIIDDNYSVINELTTRGKYDSVNPRTEIEIIIDTFDYDFCMKNYTCNGCKKEMICEENIKDKW